MGETSYFKPPWLYWSLMTGWKVFGFNLFGTFFPSALATALTALLVDRLSLNRSSVAGIWFAACTGTLTYGTTAQMEIWIVFFYSLSWWLFLRHFKTGQLKWLVAGMLVTGVSAWNKSPLYSVFSVLGYWLYLLLAPGGHGPAPARSVKAWFLKPGFYLTHLLGVAVGLSYFVAMWFTDRERFWNHYVLRETLGKRGGNGSTALHMWADFSTFTIPFLLLLIPCLARFFRLGRERVVFLFCWSLIPAAFFSYFPYRTETYLYILIPALALLLDWGLEDGSGALLRWTSRLNGLVIALALLACAALLGFTQLVALPWAVLLAVTSGLFFSVSWGYLSTEAGRLNPRWLAFSALSLIFAIRVCALSMGENDLRDLRAHVAANPDRPIAILDQGRNIWHETGLLSVAIAKPALRVHTADEVRGAIQRGAIVVLSADQSEILPKDLSLKSSSWWRLQRNFALPSLEELRHVADQKNRREFKLVWLP
jgi:4-amino-4-deoxy-L-arabinose transferase-like glycosyltransferase